MRKLKTSDIPAFCRCLKQLGLKDKLRDITRNSDKIADVWEKGFDLIWDIFDAATEAGGEQALYRFLAGPFEMTPEEVAGMDILAMLENIKKLAEENDLKAFFNAVKGLMK